VTTPLPPDLASALTAKGIDLNAALAAANAAGGGTTSKKQQVWLGDHGIPSGPLPGLGGFKGVPYKPGGQTGFSIADPAEGDPPPKSLVDIDKAKLDILKWTEAEQEALAAKLVAAGMLPEDYTRSQLENAWENMVELAARYQSVGKDLTPYDMIDLYGGTDITTGKSNKPTVSTVAQRQVSLSDPEEARRILNDALSNQLGRRATQEEMDDFQAALNDAQRANPVLQQSTTNTDGKGNTTVSSTASGGLDVGGFTDEYARSGDHEKEYARYQAATTYTNALLQAIQAPV